MRLEQVVEIDPNHEEALRRARALLPQPAPVARSHQHLRAPHLGDARSHRRRSSSTAAIAQVYADEIEDLDRAIDAYRNIVDLDDTNIPALEALVEALRQAGRCGAGHRLHDARRRADGRRQAARRDVLPDRQGSSTRSSAIASPAQERYEMALDLDPAHLPTLAALRVRSRSTTPTGTARRATSIRSRAQHRGARASAHAPRRARQAPRRDARRARQRRPGLRARAAERSRQRGRGAAARRRVRRDGAVGEGRAARSRCSPEGAASASAASSTRSRTCSARCSRRSARTTRRSRPTRRRTSSISPTRRRSAASPTCASASRTGPARSPTTRRCSPPRRGRDRGARRRLLQARLHQAGAGPGEAGDQQLREGARRRRRAPADARGARRHLRRPQGLEAGLSPTSGRSSTTSSTATSASRCSTRSATSGPTRRRTRRRRIEALEEALDLEPREPRRSSTSCCSSTRRRRTGRG